MRSTGCSICSRVHPARDVAPSLEVRAFKKRAFEAVLAEEEARLVNVPDLLGRLRQIVTQL